MLDSENSNRNVNADRMRIDFFKQNPGLIRVFTSQEYRVLWKFLHPFRYKLLFLALLSFVLAFFEGIKALALIGFIRSLFVSGENVLEVLNIPILGKNYFANQIIQFVNIQTRAGFITLLFAIVCTTITATAAINLLDTWLTKKVQMRVIRDVRSAVVEKIFSFDLDYFNHARSGELIFLMNAETSRFSNVFNQASQFLKSFTQVIIFLCMLLYMFFDVSIVVLFVCAMLFIVHLKLDSGMKIKSLESNLSQNLLSHFFHQIIYGIKMIKIGNLEAREKDHYVREHKRFERSEIVSSLYIGISRAIQEFGMVGIIVIVSGYLYLTKDINAIMIKPDMVLGYLFLIVRTIPVAGQLQQARSGMIASYGPLSRVINMLHTDTYGQTPVWDREHRPMRYIQQLSVKNLSYGYKNKSKVLRNVTLHFFKGRNSAVVGFSGSGKSTLLDILSAIRIPETGILEVNGSRLSTEDLFDYRSSIGYMNQEPIIFHDTIRQNVSYFRPEASETEIWEALKMAEAYEFVKKLPDGIDTGVGERGLTVSGGERQRLGLARIFLQNASILLLDEATNALDYETEKRVYENISKVKDERIIVVAAHRLSAIQNFDNIIVVHEGSVVERGCHLELMENKSYYYNLLRAQDYSK